MAKKKTRRKAKPDHVTTTAAGGDEPSSSASDRIPDGITLLRTFTFHKDAKCLSWSPDGRTLAVGSHDGAVRFCNLKTGKLGQEVDAIGGYVNALAWTADGRRLAVGGNSRRIAVLDVESLEGRVKEWDRTESMHGLDAEMDGVYGLTWSPQHKAGESADVSPTSPRRTTLAIAGVSNVVRVVDPTTGAVVTELDGHESRVFQVSWSADGRQIASASGDSASATWEAETGQLVRRLLGHDAWVNGIAWAPDGCRVVSSSGDSTVRVWNSETGEQEAVLEGHAGRVYSATVDATGRVVASHGGDGDNPVRMWRLDTVALLAPLRDIKRANYQSLEFHPARPMLAARADDGRSVLVWKLDLDRMLGAAPVADSVRYANAKVVLVGDTGVGKSGMRERLVRSEFQPTISTHARVVETLQMERVDDLVAPDRQIDHETLLWDLAGQPGYRLVNQLSLDDAAVALVMFDARSETDPFSAARFWAKALDQSRSGTGLKRFLVAARVDRGGVGVSRQRIDEFCQQHKFDGFYRTSALTGEGCDELKAAVFAAIDWTKLPIISSSRLLTDIRMFVKELDDRQRLLSVHGMWEAFCVADGVAGGRAQRTPSSEQAGGSLRSTPATRDTDVSAEEFASCLRRLHQADAVELLDYGADHEAPGQDVDVLLDPYRCVRLVHRQRRAGRTGRIRASVRSRPSDRSVPAGVRRTSRR